MTTEQIRAAMRGAGYTVRTTLDGRTAEQTFASEASRDAYIARAARVGATVEVVAAAQPSK